MNEGRLLVLLVEDEPADARLVERRLADPTGSGSRLALERVDALGPALDRLAKGDVDVVLLDLHLPDSSGLDTLERLREREPRVPVVVFTVAGDDRTALRALQAGAQDFLVKDELGAASALRRSIRHAVERGRMQRENERLQERLREAEKSESLRVLALGAAYGFNNLLGVMLDRIDRTVVQLRGGPPVDRLKTALLAVRKNALRAADLASQLRDYATSRGSPPGPLDLSNFVVDCSELLETIASGRTTLRYDLPGNLPRVRADPLQLRQLLVHLVVNAAEALGESGGTISVNTGQVDADARYLAGCRAEPDIEPGPFVALEVADTGPPLDDATRARIFDPFFTTKLAGRGLGLAAVLGIVRRHAGAIRVDSARGRGTRFTVLLPVFEGEVPEPKA